MGRDLIKELEKKHEKELEKMGVCLSSGVSLSGMIKAVVAGVFAFVLSLGSVNYMIHSGSLKPKCSFEVKGVAMPTDLASYVEYRRYEKPLLGNDVSKIDVIVNGNFLHKEEEYYFDYDSDRNVGIIYFGGYPSYKEKLWRAMDYKKNKTKFDQADKFFTKYLKELKEKT